jgi:hypothetical protein
MIGWHGAYALKPVRMSPALPSESDRAEAHSAKVFQ